MWKKIRESLLFLIVGLILLVFGGFHFVQLAIVPHLKRLLGAL